MIAGTRCVEKELSARAYYLNLLVMENMQEDSKLVYKGEGDSLKGRGFVLLCPE